MRKLLLTLLAAGALSMSNAPQRPVLVELFTSQGCSSCPPADALVSRLAREHNVIPLSFHVDYWDRLGWRDPFSQRAWSQRQGVYSQRFGRDSVYTPQIVVDGAAEAVGSKEREVRAAIERAASTAPRAEFRDASVTRTNGVLQVRYDVTSSDRDAAVNVAVFERSRRTAVANGENGGRELVNTNVVRLLTRCGCVGSGQCSVRLDPSWSDTGVALFVQDGKTMQVLAATAR